MEDIKSSNIRDMFDNISANYDKLNSILTLGIDSVWRKKAVRLMELKPRENILDLACGTGKLIHLIKRTCPEIKAVGADFSCEMLKIASKKYNKEKYAFVAADALNLPFKDESFDKVIIGFGFRNFCDKEKAISEIFRVLKKGGRLCLLELSMPQSKIFNAIYKLYFFKIVPFIGKLVSKDNSAYTYLPNSVKRYHEQFDVKAMLEKSFYEVKNIRCSFGMCNILVALKP